MSIHGIRLFVTICLGVLFCLTVEGQSWNPSHKIGTTTGVTHFSYNQTPAQLVEVFAAGVPNTGLSYQWEQCSTPAGTFTSVSGATGSGYSFPGPLSQTMYYRRKTTNGAAQSIYSNVVKISVVSVNWEDHNYIREHNVMKTGQTSWTAVDQLAIGDKLQTTTYMDGLGRGTEVISRETATPAGGVGTWGDIVQFSQYDVYGREPLKYLPYSTTTQPGRYKTTFLSEQPQYYTSVYSETSAFSKVTFDNSPLSRVNNVKKPGTSWAGSTGNSAAYELNTLSDSVQIFEADYVQGNAPVHKGAYYINLLFKLVYADENGKQVVEFTNKSGQLILKKVQLDNAPAGAYTGWICTYNVYDDFGLLRYQIQPEGVNYLAANSWSFAGSNGALILAEQCFQYEYDEKGRNVWKKAPGAQPLKMLFDSRDRVVFMQDGNQGALSTAQWTGNLYDELDRSVISTLYNTTKSQSTLQSDINNASGTSTITITNPGQAVVNLSLNERQAGVTTYKATTCIDLVSDDNGNFESLSGDAFTVEIDPTAMTSQISVTSTTLQNPISNTDLANSTLNTILKYQFYDNYSYSAAKSFDTHFTNTSAYGSSDPNVQAIAKTVRTTSMPTGSMTRVLGATNFLSSTYYYDERGALIQTLEDNIKSGVDITTLQYHFDGRVLSSCNEHTTPATDYTHYKTLTKYLFDKLGRVTSIQKKFGSNAFKTVASYEFDDVGRLKMKRLAPGYTAGGNTDLESLAYSYNIHSQITGINKDYALKTSGTYNKWGHFFGLYLGYDNRDNAFAAANLNGQVTGTMWNTQGDDAQRKYDYSYDNAGRLIEAAFKEKKHTGDSWINSEMDFSVNGSGGKITYDLNGNLLKMLHKGVIPGNATPATIDDLTYTYSSYSNKLQSVIDSMSSTTVNGMFGDFKDGINTSTPDYVYDANGNVVIDLNKNAKELNQVSGANGIKYNFLDKPEEIRIAGKGTIKITYSADGRKLQRKFTSETDNTVRTTSYINQFIYEESANTSGATISGLALTMMNFEEGRIRVVTPTSQNNGLDALIVDGNMDLPGGKRGAYDYFIMDYQQNVRMIVSEQTHTALNTATMETSRSTLEESIFGQTGSSNKVATSRHSPVPSGWTGNSSSYVSRLGTGRNIGPNVLQKVMAGDKVTATVQYYHEGSPGGNNTSFVSTMLGSLTPVLSSSGSVGSVVKNNASAINTQLNGLSGFVNAVQPNGSNPVSSTPQAFLTVLFFDERFNFIGAADGGVAQEQVAASVSSSGAPLALPDVKAPKNGYVYVYISNQSNNYVYFDDFKVQIVQGNIVEENHYYSYGLKISALSSKKLGDSYDGSLKNNYLYQGSFSELDEEIGWNDFALRNYDPQIGRWVQQDPYQEFASGYVGMGGDPVNFSDPSGGSVLCGLNGIERVAASTVLGAIVGTVIGVISGDDDFTGTITGASLGLLGGLAISNEFIKLSGILNVINAAATNGVLGTSHTYGAKNPFKAIHDAVRDWWKDVTNDYVDDPQKLKIIENSLRDAKQLLEKRIASLTNWGPTEQSDFQTLFGTTIKFARDIVMERMNRTLKVVKQFLTNGNYKEQFFETDDNSFAHVYSYDVDLEIFLDAIFWNGTAGNPPNMSGRDSRPGTILHELSHFLMIGSTKDHKYGLNDAKKLAIKSPSKALVNADNYEYYLEGGPY